MPSVARIEAKLVTPERELQAEPSGGYGGRTIPRDTNVDALTPANIKTLLQNAESGDIAAQAELFELMEERDGEMAAHLRTRKAGVSQADWTIQPADDTPAAAGAAEFAQEVIAAIPDVDDAIFDLLDAVGKGEGVETTAKEIAEKLTAIEEKLHQFRAKSSQDVLNLRQGIDGQLMGLLSAVESAQARPTDSTLARYQELRTELNGYLGELKQVFDTEVAAFNDQVRATGVPAVFPSEGL